MNRVILDDAQFEALCLVLREAAGLVFDGTRRDSLALSLGERLRASGCPDVDSYLRLLDTPAGEPERQLLLDEVTIPETHFFRNPPQIRALRRHVLPQLLQSAGERGGHLRVWSAGCSTGEEPYTVAMLIGELLPANPGLDVKIIATDVSTRALAAARRARYGERSLHLADPVDVARWLTPCADQPGMLEVREDVRRLVEFRHHNLVTDPTPFEPGSLDLILCRNVTIYFRRDTTVALMRRLHTAVRDGGYLFLGHAETLWQISDEFSLVGLGDAFVYRRLDGVPERRAVLPDRRTAEPPVARRSERRLQPRRAERVTAPPAPSRPTVGAVRASLAGGRYDEAVNLTDSMIEFDPLRAEAHYLRGLSLTNLGRDAEAMSSLRKAVYLEPADGLAQFLLGGALERLGEPAAAARAYRAAAGALCDWPPTTIAPELGGRRPAELATLCRQLADRTEPQGAVTGSVGRR
ncbi:MAG TPA: CheR family methyltransferase [Mycobacteriales bacterium]|nr:CheR family methyltransferase [Mycobacteriales bacterium]